MRANLRVAATVLGFALVLSLIEYLGVRAAAESMGVRVTRLTEIFALTSTVFFYVAVLIPPLKFLIPELNDDQRVNPARKAALIAAVYFSVWHVVLAFFTQLGGFGGLPFLNDRYLLSVIIGFTGLVAMTIFAVVSSLRINSRYLKPQVVSVVGYILLLVITLHALMLGNHFASLLDIIPQIFLGAMLLLLILEGLWLDKWLAVRYKSEFNFGPVFVVCVAIAAAMVTMLFVAPVNISLNVHNDHGISADGSGLPVPMPSAPASDQITKVVKDYSVTVKQLVEAQNLSVKLVRLSAEQPEAVGQGQGLFVNESALTSFKVEGTLTTEDPGIIVFNFPLSAKEFAPGIHTIYLKFYLATGGLQTEFTVNLQ